jgi:predicted site-specific integrase-resolvase
VTSELLSLSEWAKQVGVHRSRAAVWAGQGRIVGAVQVGGRWIVPSDAPRPAAEAPGRRAGYKIRPPGVGQ